MARSSHSNSPSVEEQKHMDLEPSKQVAGDTAPYALMAVLLTLYFAQGLPAGFITQALPAILREYQVSLEMIGLSGMLLIPWALKFLWAPVVDKYFIAKWGRSRSWILPLQLLSALIVAIVGLINPNQLSSPETLWTIYSLLFLLSLIGATHDVAADGLATRSLTRLLHNASSLSAVKNPYQGMGNAAQVVGYRMGLILGGGVLLLVLGQWSWRYSFFAMAALIVLNTIPIWLYPENKAIPIDQPSTNQPSIQLKEGSTEQKNKTESAKLSWSTNANYIKDQYGYFWSNPQMRAWLAVLLTFKIVDGVSSGMVKPMMVDMGIATGDIGLWASVLGSVASLGGAGLAAWLLKRMAHHNALVAFNIFQVATTALYIVVAIGLEYPDWFGFAPQHSVPFWWAYAANAVEHLAAAMALVAMLTMIMHYARHDKAGSDFTTQVCLLTVFSGGAHLISGFIATEVGYSGHFILSVALGCLCLLPLFYWRKRFVTKLAA